MLKDDKPTHYRVRVSFEITTADFRIMLRLRKRIHAFLRRNRLEWTGTTWDPVLPPESP